MKRAIHAALRSVEAAEGSTSSELAVEHLTGAVNQLAFVVSHLMEDLDELKKRIPL